MTTNFDEGTNSMRSNVFNHVLSTFCSVLLVAAASGQSAPTVQERLGYTANARLLIIHADDLGMSHSVNRAIFEAMENGWVTSASIMVPCPWFPEVARFAKAHPGYDFGIHQVVNADWNDYRWGPVTSRDKVPSLLDAQGYFPLTTPEVVKNAKIPEVETELRAQIDRARAVGIPLSHLDTHMGTLLASGDLFNAYLHMGHIYGLPVLLERVVPPEMPAGIQMPAPDEVLLDQVLEIMPGVDAKDWINFYKKSLSSLKPGVYELIVHLSYGDEEIRGYTWDHPDWGADWRQRDFDMVKSPEFRQFLKDQGFILVRWKDLSKALPKEYGKSGSR
jgi:predicted glycoside hydrolase/deacetylase ChbG (UPF0249 family)